jgi:hypothetical protein
MNKKELIRRLNRLARSNGLDFYLKGGTKHEKWVFGGTVLMIPRHVVVEKRTARGILAKAEQVVKQIGGRK